jgi:transcriptional regulator with GAF, ATPase, and Fis domain
MTVADKIAKAIKGQPIGEDQITVTVSIGVAIFPQHGTTQAQLYKHADQALYAAKNSGRDRVLLFHPELDHTGHRIDRFAGLFDGDPARTQRNLKAVFDTIDLLRSAREPGEVLQGTLDNVCDLTRAQRAMLIIQDGEGGLRVVAARGHGGKQLDTAAAGDYSHSSVKRALEQRRSLCVLDTVGDDRLSTSSIDRLGLLTVMAVPLSVAGEPFGVLYADDTTANREFGDVDLAHFEMMAHQVALTLSANPQLYEAASGRSEERETTRLRAEVARLKAEMRDLLDQTRQFRVSPDLRRD